MVLFLIRFVCIVVSSFFIAAITVVFTIVFFLVSSFFVCPFYFDCYHHLLLIHSNSFFFCFVLPLDRHNNLRHRIIHSHNIFVYFFSALKVFYNNIDIHLRCRCFQYVLFSNFFFFCFFLSYLIIYCSSC